MTGSIVHLEIKVTNMPRAKKFYGKLFGWTFKDFAPTYSIFKAGKESFGGALDKVKTVSGKDATIPYIAVPSVEKTLAATKKMKIKTLIPRTEIGGGMGVMARIKDTEGNIIGIWSQK